MPKNLFYLHPDYAEAFEAAGLGTFEQLWDMELDDVEPGNLRRGGFSRVSRLEVDGQVFFLKRQENQLRKSWGAVTGAPTYFFEFRFLQRYAEPGAPMPVCALYAERTVAEGRQAILVTKGLDNMRDLQARAEAGEDLLPLMPSVGRTLYWFHSRRLQHMAVQPCHLFVGDEGECSLIDMERSRSRISGRRAMLKDLRQLARRSPWLDRAHLELMLADYPERWRRAAITALAPPA